jgi:hypothetical protein
MELARAGHLGPGTYSFATIRNPWDRAVSFYYRDMRNGRLIREPVESLHVEFSEWLHRYGWKRISGSNRGARDILCDPASGELMVSRVLQYENDLEVWINALLTDCGRPGRIRLKTVNRSISRPDVHYSAYYRNESDVALVHELCGWEIDNFGYEFDRQWTPASED